MNGLDTMYKIDLMESCIRDVRCTINYLEKFTGYDFDVKFLRGLEMRLEDDLIKLKNKMELIEIC